MSTGTHYSDEDARRLISDALDETLIVEAAAGTGKTTELVNRILRVIAEGRAGMHEIVAVTFTEKAAGELKLRLRQRLEDARREAATPIEASRLSKAVETLEEARVSTIHGFCADLLRERPVEARIDPLFRVLTEGQAERLFSRAFDAWLQEQLERPPEGIRRSLRRTTRASFSGNADQDGPIERLRRAAYATSEWRDFRGAWTREPFDRAAAAAEIVRLVHECARLSRTASRTGDNLFLDTEPVRRVSLELPNLEHDLDGLESILVDLGRNRDFRRARKGSGTGYGAGVSRADVLAARDGLAAALGDFQMRADADLAAALHEELVGCIDRYEALKAREGAMDFLDLLLRARDLVRGDGDVRARFQQSFKRIFVDEFQDTDPLQAELLLLLAAGDPAETDWRRAVPVPGKLFIVGDPKQSIYRFRRADVGTYLDVRERLERTGARSIELRRSFRAVPNIQRAVNLAFRPLMDGNPDTLQAAYVPLEPSRADHPAQPSVVVLPVPEPYAQRYVAAARIEASLPDAVGAYVEWLLTRSGWTVADRRSQERVPIEAHHICILFRRFLSFGADVTRPYVESLEARGIRHLLVGGRTFHDREEIETLRAALMAIEWPDDQLSVFATLRGSLFALGDEELLEYYGRARCFHPYRIPEGLPQHLEPVRDALQVLALLHRRRNRRPVADTISALLEQTRAHVAFVLRAGGEQALANVLYVAELARQYELDGGMSFRGFIDTLHARASSQQASEAPILEEGSDGVRLMTVHKAKGLEFPVVILADLTARLTPWEPSRYVDAGRQVCAQRIGAWSPADLNAHRDMELAREQAEGERVAYVAATRARDLLVVPAVGDGPYEGWVAPLNGALYPPVDARGHYTPAQGCPLFKSRDSVLNRPDGDPATPLTVCPGGHRLGGHTGDDEVSVVWWSPAALTLGVQAALGLKRDDLIVKDVSPDVLRLQLERYEGWRTTRNDAIAAGSIPSMRVKTATEWATATQESTDDGEALPDLESLDAVEVTVEAASNVEGRPAGPRFGTLVHAVLADIPLDGSTTAIEGLAAAHGRVLGATDDEVAAARAVALDVLRHPVMREAALASADGRCYRETPITWRTGDDTLVEGNVDLAYLTPDALVVVDFKTDRELEGSLERYRRQVQIYCAAVGQALGRHARGVLLKV